MPYQLLNYPSVLNYLGYVVSIADDYAPGSRRGVWSVNDGGSRDYVNRLKITTSSKFMGAVAILSALPVKLGDHYTWPVASFEVTENDTGAFLQSIELEQVSEDGLQWAATLTYNHFHVPHEMGVSYVAQGVFDPLEQVPKLEWDQAKYERYKPYDESGNPLADPPVPGAPYVNTVWDPLEDPPRTEETRPILKFARAEAIYNDAYASTFKDTTNGDEFLGYPPNTVKCRDIRGERRYTADWGYYWWVSYEFEFRDDDDGNGYTEQILNAGYRAFAAANTTPPIDVVINGSKVSAPVPLQKDGTYKPLTPNPKGAPTDVLPYYLPFEQFPQVKFADLNIEDDILTADQ